MLRLGSRLICLLVLLTGLLTGCAASEPDRAGQVATASSVGERQVRAQRTVDDFVAAARRGDENPARALVSVRDPAFAARAAVWSANLARIPWAGLTWTVRRGVAAVPDDRRAVLGDQAWVQQVDVTWTLPGEHRAAEEVLWLTFVDEPSADGGGSVTRLVGDDAHSVGAGSRAAASSPIWLQQPVRLLQREGVLVLTNATDAEAWTTQAAAARRAVAARVGGGPADRATGDPLVVEVPQSRAVFERIIGVAPGSYASVAAAAWPMGSDTGTAPVHVVVNPEASRRLSGLGRDVLLVHESVHVATRSPGSSVPTWLVEGYADLVAYDARPAGRAPAEQTVRTQVREQGTPRTWPAEEDFAPDADDLDLSYDLGWTTARSIADAYGSRRLDRLYAALADGDSMAEAAERIGTSEASLLRHWRDDVKDLAAR